MHAAACRWPACVHSCTARGVLGCDGLRGMHHPCTAVSGSSTVPSCLHGLLPGRVLHDCEPNCSRYIDALVCMVVYHVQMMSATQTAHLRNLHAEPWHPLNFRNQIRKYEAEQKAIRDQKVKEQGQVCAVKAGLGTALLDMAALIVHKGRASGLPGPNSMCRCVHS